MTGEDHSFASIILNFLKFSGIVLTARINVLIVNVHINALIASSLIYVVHAEQIEQERTVIAP